MSEQQAGTEVTAGNEQSPAFDAKAEFKSAMSEVRGEKIEPQASASEPVAPKEQPQPEKKEEQPQPQLSRQEKKDYKDKRRWGELTARLKQQEDLIARLQAQQKPKESFSDPTEYAANNAAITTAISMAEAERNNAMLQMQDAQVEQFNDLLSQTSNPQAVTELIGKHHNDIDAALDNYAQNEPNGFAVLEVVLTQFDNPAMLNDWRNMSHATRVRTLDKIAEKLGAARTQQNNQQAQPPVVNPLPSVAPERGDRGSMVDPDDPKVYFKQVRQEMSTRR